MEGALLVGSTAVLCLVAEVLELGQGEGAASAQLSLSTFSAQNSFTRS